MPHETIDAIVIASEIVLAWQTIVARSMDPMTPAVISVGQFNAGTVNNVIAERAELSCSIRSLSLEVRDFLVRRMQRGGGGSLRGPRGQLLSSPSPRASHRRSTLRRAPP